MLAHTSQPPNSGFPFEPGIVRLVEPEALLEQGAEVAGVDDVHRVFGPHLFVIAATREDQAVLAVIYSRGGRHRIAIPRRVRTGHPKWAEGSSHVARHQLWFASKYAIDQASRAAGDASLPDNPNRVSANWLRKRLWGRFQQLDAYKRLLSRVRPLSPLTALT
jgi:hypothetical protein